MALNKLPLVSVITPVYNGAEYIDELIESVLWQDYPNIEHLVIDDGSQDDGATVAILRKYPHLCWWSRENKGQYATMNEGFMAAKGEFICFVSADDLVSPGAVSAAMYFMKTYPDFDGVFGVTNYMDSYGNAYPIKIPFRKAPMSYIPYFAHVSHCSLYVKRSSLRNYQLLFNPELRLVGDYDWMIRISKSPLKIGAIEQELSKVRVHSGQISRKEHQSSLVERKEVLKHHQINWAYHFLLSKLYFLCARVFKVGLLFKRLMQVGKERLTRRK